MSGDLFWPMVRVLISLPLVLGMAFLVIKYGLARRYVTTPGKRRMKLVEQLPLGPKTVLSLVALEGKYYLLAHQDSSVALVKELGELPEPEGAKAGDIVELTPRTIEDLDRLQGSGGSGEAGRLPESLKGRFGPQLEKLAGGAAKAKKILAARIAGRVHTGVKDEKKVEG